MSFNIVLITPEIPNNTGNIGRLCLATGSRLHLVKPLGFEITDTRLKRAGLDYWKHLEVIYYDSVEVFLEQHKNEEMSFLSSGATKSYLDIPFKKGSFLVFGKESSGLSSQIKNTYKEQLYGIPLYSEHIRSLNIANAVSVVAYEGLRVINTTV